MWEWSEYLLNVLFIVFGKCTYLTGECPEVICIYSPANAPKNFVRKECSWSRPEALGKAWFRTSVGYFSIFISSCNNWTGLYIFFIFVLLLFDYFACFCVVYAFVTSIYPIRSAKRPWLNHGIEGCLTPSPRSTEFLSRNLCSQTSLRVKWFSKRIFQKWLGTSDYAKWRLWIKNANNPFPK